MDRVILEGILTFGDRYGSIDVDRIHINDVTYYSAQMGIYLNSMHNETGLIKIHGYPSSWNPNVEINAAGDIYVDTNFNVNGTLKAVVNADCIDDFIRGTLQLTANGSITTSNYSQDITIWGGALDLNPYSHIHAGKFKIY